VAKARFPGEHIKVLAGVCNGDGVDTSDNGRHPWYLGFANCDIGFFMSPAGRFLIGLIPHLMGSRPAAIKSSDIAEYRGAMFQSALCKILEPFRALWTTVFAL
jgi:hypothetical protein